MRRPAAFTDLELICVVDSRTTELNVRDDACDGRRGADRHPSPIPAAAICSRRGWKLVAPGPPSVVPGSFWPDQYANTSNADAHSAGTMREIDEALDGDLDYLFVATSTAGTLSGCIDYLRSHEPPHVRRRRRPVRRQRPVRGQAGLRGGCRASGPESRRPPSSGSSPPRPARPRLRDRLGGRLPAARPCARRSSPVRSAGAVAAAPEPARSGHGAGQPLRSDLPRRRHRLSRQRLRRRLGRARARLRPCAAREAHRGG